MLPFNKGDKVYVVKDGKIVVYTYNGVNASGRPMGIDESSGEDFRRVEPEALPEEGVFGSRSEAWTDEERQLATDYVNARTIYDGMVQRVRDAIDDKVTEVRDEVSGRTNNDTGMIHAATLKDEDRQVYIIGGNVTVNDDGTLNASESSESLIVRDAETGVVEFVAPSDILKVESAIDPEQEATEAEAQVTQDMAQAAAAEIDGNAVDGGEPPIGDVEPTSSTDQPTPQTGAPTAGDTNADVPATGRRPTNPVDAAYPDSEKFVVSNIGNTFTLDDGARVTIISYDPQQTMNGRKYPYATVVVEQNGEQEERTIHVDDLAEAIKPKETEVAPSTPEQTDQTPAVEADVTTPPANVGDFGCKANDGRGC